MREIVTSDNNFDTGRYFVDVMRQWQNLEEALKSGVKPIDFDIAPIRKPLYKIPTDNRRGVEWALSDVLGGLNTSLPDGRYLKAKILASLAYLQAIREKDNVPLGVYVDETMGIVPRRVPQREIEWQYNRTQEKFNRLGYDYNKEGWSKFIRENSFNPRGIEDTFARMQQKTLPIMEEILGPEARRIWTTYRTVYVVRDEPWINWTGGDRKGLVLQVNLHPRNQARWFRGSEEVLYIHEIAAHFGQAGSWKIGIDRRELNPGYGVTSIPGPEQWTMEGSATSLPYLVRPLHTSLTEFGKFALDYRYLTHLVNSNVLLDLNTSIDQFEPHQISQRKEELTDEVQRLLPGELRGRIRKLFEKGTKDSVYLSYYWAYQDGARYFRRLANDLPSEVLDRLVRELYLRPMIPQQVKEFVEEQKNQVVKDSRSA